jgi:hypothetical protein
VCGILSLMAWPDQVRQLSRRRWVVITGGVALLIGAFAAAWWFLWVPNWRPRLNDGERYGVDVSAHQGSIDWGRVSHDGITFAYMKATEGGDFVDERFEETWNGAAAAGLDRGAYHFFTLCTPVHPVHSGCGTSAQLSRSGACHRHRAGAGSRPGTRG